jgi:superfamily II DNA or RNA helicase
VVLYGGMSATESRVGEEGIKRPGTEERLVVATGRYLGEGLDDPSLDTLFLTMPITWCGTLAQYVGRLHREHHAKREVIVYDYVDSHVPLLSRMVLKGQSGYRSLGCEILHWMFRNRLSRPNDFCLSSELAPLSSELPTSWTAWSHKEALIKGSVCVWSRRVV